MSCRWGAVSIVLALALSATACGGESPESSSISSASPTVDRNASWTAYKTRICVTNTSSTNIALEWNPNMQNGKSEYLKPSELKRTLGPNAFDCAVSYATLNAEFGDFTIDGKALETENNGVEIYFRFPGEPHRIVRSDRFAVLTWPDEAKPGRSLKARATTTDELERYEQSQVYPIDIRISETQTNEG